MSTVLGNPVGEALKRLFWIALVLGFMAGCVLVLLAYCVVVIAVCAVPALIGVWVLFLIGELLYIHFGYTSVLVYALVLLIVAVRLLDVEVKNQWAREWSKPNTEPYFWLDD